MNWARDNTGLNDKDLEHVFKYEEKPTTVVQMIDGAKNPIIWSLEGKREWAEWLQGDCPDIDGSASGLVLILAKRTGEPTFGSIKKVGTDDWLNMMQEQKPLKSKAKRALTFESLAEKHHGSDSSPGASNSTGQRSVRTLPFSKEIFRTITKRFYTHSSIAPVISRADIPVFSSADIEMRHEDGHTYPAYVYNCRTTNAWEMDLALTATYFPHCGLTFAILFGCPLSVEEEILQRLSHAMAEASYPLLMPGIFVELERTRHINIVEATIDEIETRIMELDFDSSNMDEMPSSETDTRNQDKRSAWLDTTYLRNGLVSWNTQLGKISIHVDELNESVFRSPSAHRSQAKSASKVAHLDSRAVMDTYKEHEGEEENPDSQFRPVHDEADEVDIHRGSDNMKKPSTKQYRPEDIGTHMRRVGHKVKDRVKTIIDEYDDKIRDCTMRVDGMAMATQWAQGETNVGIALATNRDSKHMRSIALVTMIFLPGTFFASLFSMTFFNWNTSDGPVVSSLFWIYALCTILSTLLTLGGWWYFVVYRPSHHHKKTIPEEQIPLV